MYCCVTGSENEMKKLFTADDFMVAFISALGYGFGETIARISGWSELMCIAASFAVGIVLEEIIGGIVFSKAVQKNKNRRMLTFAAILLVFLLGQYISVKWMGTSLAEYLQEEILFVVGLPMIGFVVNLLLRGYRAWKIRKVYGDGSRGYVFDLKEEDIEETNRENRPITGEYDAELAVKTRTGIFVGEKQKKIIYYLGIPYAEPPVGELRWRAPVSLPASDAVFEAKNFGASAIQVEQQGLILKHHRQSEDCLTLNVFVGEQEQETEKKRPVLVLFHHGDFTYGGSADPLLYGESFAGSHPDVVCVSFNYRLGIFGFIDFSEVPGGEAYPDALNLGLLDQIAALKWIKENIAAFGGDPDRITVMGFEAGATSICLLAASEQTKGLFRKAFVFDGSLETVFDTPEASRTLAKKLLKETGTSTMEELLQLKTETLRDAAQKLWLDKPAPTCDGTLIPADVYRAYQDGAASGIDFVMGIPANERQVFRSFVGNQNYRDFTAAAVADMQNYADGSIGARVLELTENVSPGMPEAGAKLVEQWIALNIYRSAGKLSESGSQVYLMYWDTKPLIENLGSGTVDAAAALLGNREALQLYGNVMNQDLSEILQCLLYKFVSGNAMQLYHNEIYGVDALRWKTFPTALIVSDGKLLCGRIEDRIYSP